MDPILGRWTKPPRSVRRLIRLLLLGIVVLFNPGCVFDKLFPPEHGIQPLEPNVSPTALIEHLNLNIQNLHSWSCTDATITTRPSKYLPVNMTLSAKVSVERDKNFRLRARSPLGEEADFGSNRERFWFWMRRGAPYVFTARHEDIEAVGPRLQIPFHPAWIMEALGVVPLDPGSITVRQPGNQPHTMLLVSDEISPAQTRVRREIVVDTRLGVILTHRLYDAAGQRLAEARLSRHRREPSGIVMPHVIELELDGPQQQMAMTLELSDIEVNPSHLAQGTWELPKMPAIDMGRRLEHVEIPGPHVPAGERTTQTATWLEPPPFADSPPNEAAWHTTGPPGRTAVRSEPEAPPFF